MSSSPNPSDQDSIDEELEQEYVQQNDDPQDDEFYDEFDDELEGEESGGKQKKKRSGFPLHCFNCNRLEEHFSTYKGRWFYSYLTGLTFGLVYLFGPFRCRCCGHSRMMRRNWMHPKFLFRDRGKTSKGRR